jgi:hypothetical protein
VDLVDLVVMVELVEVVDWVLEVVVGVRLSVEVMVVTEMQMEVLVAQVEVLMGVMLLAPPTSSLSLFSLVAVATTTAKRRTFESAYQRC